MSDARSIVRLYDHSRQHNLPVVLATVVRTSGSTYRKPGARMMLCADGSRVGVVSGGCLEGDVTRRAWYLKTPEAAELITYDTGSGDDATYEFGLGCRGMVDVVVERLDLIQEPAVIRLLRESVEQRITGHLEIDLCGYSESIRPPIQIVIFGSGLDVSPLVTIANELGWSVVVVDHKLSRSHVKQDVQYVAEPGKRWMDAVRIDDRTACVLMTHRMKDDEAYLLDVIASGCRFIGCLGPLSRTEALIDELALAGVTVSDSDRGRIRAPVGLDLGAERPQEIALSIISEIATAMSGTAGGFLSRRDGPIHKLDSATQLKRNG